jgi:hypothetical protein
MHASITLCISQSRWVQVDITSFWRKLKKGNNTIQSMQVEYTEYGNGNGFRCRLNSQKNRDGLNYLLHKEQNRGTCFQSHLHSVVLRTRTNDDERYQGRKGKIQ